MVASAHQNTRSPNNQLLGTPLESPFPLAANLDLPSAAAVVWPVVIVGAGPAGSLAALALAQRGIRTLLVDRAHFPRWKVCGACLNPSFVPLLRRLGLVDLLTQESAVALTGFHLGGWQRQVDLPLAGGFALSRYRLDAALIRAAMDRQVAFLPGIRATLVSWANCKPTGTSDPFCTLCLQPERRATDTSASNTSVSVLIRARLVLAADGLGSGLTSDLPPAHNLRPQSSSRIGAGTVLTPVASTTRNGSDSELAAVVSAYAPGVIYMAVSATGYVGLVRQEDGSLNAAGAFDREVLRTNGGPAAVAATILQQAGFPHSDHFQTAVWKGTPALTRQAQRLTWPGVWLLGDAAGYIEPFTGEGMTWAGIAGLYAAECVPLYLAGQPERAERRWRQLFHHRLRNRQRFCRWVSRGLRSAWGCRGLLAVLQQAPSLAWPALHLLHQRPPVYRFN